MLIWIERDAVVQGFLILHQIALLLIHQRNHNITKTRKYSLIFNIKLNSAGFSIYPET